MIATIIVTAFIVVCMVGTTKGAAKTSSAVLGRSSTSDGKMVKAGIISLILLMIWGWSLWPQVLPWLLAASCLAIVVGAVGICAPSVQQRRRSMVILLGLLCGLVSLAVIALVYVGWSIGIPAVVQLRTWQSGWWLLVAAFLSYRMSIAVRDRMLWLYWEWKGANTSIWYECTLRNAAQEALRRNEPAKAIELLGAYTEMLGQVAKARKNEMIFLQDDIMVAEAEATYLKALCKKQCAESPGPSSSEGPLEAYKPITPTQLALVGAFWRIYGAVRPEEAPRWPELPKEAFKRSRAAADLGDAETMVFLGEAYLVRKDNAEDEAEAIKWFRKAAEAGNADGMANLAVAYAKGSGVTRNDSEASTWFRKAADCYTKAADDGDTVAMVKLADLYSRGSGVPQSDSEATKWFSKAAERGNALAMACLGEAYAAGQGVSQDWGEAVRWYRRAADAGNAPAMFNLAVMYENGDGVDKNIGEAVKWYHKAADAGDSEAAKRLERFTE